MNTRDLGNTLPTLLPNWSMAPRKISESELNSVVGRIGHLAYHVGAIRQIDLSARGPSAGD